MPKSRVAATQGFELTSVVDSNLAIETLARRVQALPSEIRWLYAQQDVIRATARGAPLIPGVWSSRIRSCLSILGMFGLDLIAAKLASLLLLLVIRCRQLRFSQTPDANHFFVGISALREPELVRQFEALVAGKATVIDQRFSGALAAIYPPTMAQLLQSWRDAGRPVFADLASNRSDWLLERLALLTYVVRRLHQYAHFLAVFRGLNASSPGAVVGFSTADLPAYAAVQARMETVYFPHGFLARSLIFPDFHRVVSFNAVEADHVKYRLPHAIVSMHPLDVRPIKVTHRVAIVGDYGEKLARSRDLIEFCRVAGIGIVVRPHPADGSGYWNEWADTSGVCIDRGGTFDEFLEHHRPAVMATWYSTTIYDAIVRGVMPVTLEADQPDIVFPFSQVALRWPEQREQIQAVLTSERARYDALTKSLKVAVGARHTDAAISEMHRLFELNIEEVQ